MDGFPSRFFAALGRLLDEPVDHEAPAKLIAAIADLLRHEAAFCVVNAAGLPPTYLCDTFHDPVAKRAVQRYVQGTYLINPAYNAFLMGLPAGIYRMRDLVDYSSGRVVPNRPLEIERSSVEEIGFRTFDWPAGKEELVFAIALPGRRMGEISFSQSQAAGGFAEADIVRLKRVEPLVSALFRRIWSELEARLRKPPAPAATLDGFGRDRLSNREATIVQMVLKGHSNASISLRLGIGQATVKTHRQNAYAKLGIATQQELFAAFLRYMDLEF
jgi:DNA-binding CsgD family transcriptional regulator